MTILKLANPVEIYKVDVFCANCMERFEITVEKGKLVREAEKDKKCPKCGCTQKQFDEWLKINYNGPIVKPV